MGTLGGFPTLPALWLQPAKPASANANDPPVSTGALSCLQGDAQRRFRPGCSRPLHPVRAEQLGLFQNGLDCFFLRSGWFATTCPKSCRQIEAVSAQGRASETPRPHRHREPSRFPMIARRVSSGPIGGGPKPISMPSCQRSLRHPQELDRPAPTCTGYGRQSDNHAKGKEVYHAASCHFVCHGDSGSRSFRVQWIGTR